ncbi:recombinase family protein [Oscillibacter sp.]|uniref:recombinase family protein n=1 Tax=Oscillibacter sp. TaxID=1945593 RepID=UPI0028AC4856|nr:recombinase family protein [Oscillibacter sp.]
MAERKTEGSMALSPKENRVIVINPIEKAESALLRVAAYCRVSSDSTNQMNSFAAQNTYYTTLISSNKDWDMVDLYADAGITGTSAAKRPEFQRLIADCKKGKIDRILVKSISRFARNTKECLEFTRELKSIGVGVCFEEQNIDTSRVSGEMLTAIFAALAQKEGESISKNLRWSYQKRMRNGEFNTYHAPYGFEYCDGKLRVQPNEASTVRYIYEQYLSGQSPRHIALNLNTSSAGIKKWTRELVEYILKNERYCGNALLQKRYTTDTLPYQKKRNYGQREMHYVCGANEAIITEAKFEAAQDLRKRRYIHQKNTENCLSHIIWCEECGAAYRQKTVNGIRYWVCRTHEESIKNCSITPVPETEIQTAFNRLYFNLKNSESEVLSHLMKNLQSIRYNRLLWSMDIISLNKQISDLTSQNQLLAELQKQGLVDSDIFISQSNQLAQQLRTAKQEKERIIALDDDDTIAQIQELMDIIEHGPDFLTEFDEELFGDLVERIIVESNESLRFRLKNGLELRESIERTVR